MNKRIKKKKLKQEKMRFIKLLQSDPNCLIKAISDIAKAFHENIAKLAEELVKMAKEMKTNLFVGEEVIADGIETEVIATAYDECGEKVYIVKGSMKDYYFNELRRIHKC